MRPGIEGALPKNHAGVRRYMQVEFLGVMLVFLMVYSHIAMVQHAYAKQKNPSESSIFCYYTSYTIFDYITVTSEEDGRIGVWFWAFVISIIVLFCVAVNLIAGNCGYGTTLLKDQDSFWPFL